MATLRWLGGAVATTQVQTYTFGGTWESTDIIRVKIGQKQVDFTAGSSTTTTVVSNLVTNWLALSETDYPEFFEMTPSANSADLVLTGADPGVPFICTITPLEANLGSADDQRIEGGTSATTGTATTACTGPHHFDNALNWDTGSAPTGGDTVYFTGSDNDCLYNLDQNGTTLAALHIENSFTGQIGLKNHTGVYPEYREKFLKISATACKIGYGPGSGSGLLRLNFGSVQTTMDVLNTGTPLEQGVEALLWRGTHASNVVNVTKGSVGIAVQPSETATVATLRVGYRTNPSGDANVRCGSGVTLTTIQQTGGVLEVRSNITTLTMLDGEFGINDAATATTLNIDGGTVRYRSSGTLATAKVSDGGALDFAQDMRSRTVTNCTLEKGSRLDDRHRTVTWSNPIVLNRCSLADVDMDVGTHVTVAISAGS